VIARSARIAVEAAVGVIAGLAILGGVAIWRLSAGPVALNFLTPYLEAGIDDPERGLRVDIGETVLAWAGWPRNIDLVARQVRVSDAQGAPLAVLPDVALQLSLRALLSGTVAPTAIEVIGARVSLERDIDGEIRFGRPAEGEAGGAAAEGDFSRLLPLVLEQILSDPAPGSQLAYLSVIRVVDGQLAVRDRKLDIDWVAPSLNLDLRRNQGGLTGEVELQAGPSGDPATLELAFIYDQASDLIDLAANVESLRPSVLASLSARLDGLAGVDSLLRGQATATLRPNGRVDALDLDLLGGPGQFSVAGYLPDARPLDSMVVHARYDGSAGQLELDNAELRFGTEAAPGPTVSLTGSATTLDGNVDVTATLRGVGIDMDELDHYWPKGLAEDARAWIVDNLRTGTADEAVLETAFTLADGDPDALALQRLGGRISYSNLDVHYLRPVPPVRGVSGTATYDDKEMRLSITGGTADGGLTLGAGLVVISGFDKKVQNINIGFGVGGPLRSALLLLDHERLRLIEPLGIDASTAGGRATAEVGFHFPLLKSLKTEQIAVTAKAELADVSVRDMILGQDISQGRLSLLLDSDHLEAKGPVRLGSIPIEVEWIEDFTGAREIQSDYRVLANELDNAGRAEIGLDFAPNLSGPVSASIIAQERRDGTGIINIAANLQEAHLSLPELRWGKLPGVPGEARLSLSLQNGRLRELTSLDLNAGGMLLRGRGRFDDRGERLTWGELNNLAFNGTTLEDVTLARMGDGLEVHIGGGVLDAAPFLEDVAEEGTSPAPVPPPLRLSAPSLTAIYFAPGRYLENAALALERHKGEWSVVRLHGTLPQASAAGEGVVNAPAAAEPKTFKLDYRPGEDGLSDLDVSADDMGGVLRALDILDTVRGGEMKITGQSEPGQPIQASVEAEDFTLIDAPVLARLLMVASLSGIVEGLTSSGIDFDRLTGDFSLDGGRIETELIRAYGSSLGLTAKGKLDIDADTIDIKGTLVPAYLVNQILSSIPVLGTLLTGGEGEGLVAFVYDMNGDLKEPDISVNPLSALTPGFLRGVFSGSGVSDEPMVFPPGADR